MKDINIALLGFGTVGSGVAEAIRRNGEALSAEIGCRLHLKTVLVRNPEKYEHLEVLRTRRRLASDGIGRDGRRHCDGQTHRDEYAGHRHDFDGYETHVLLLFTETS